MPSYGQNASQGRYLKKLGYFWAVNEFVNSQFFFDFYDERGFFSRAETATLSGMVLTAVLTSATTDLLQTRKSRIFSTDPVPWDGP
jgi:hypothetical protein